jgi:GT2 family glycosyltransferase
MIWANRLSSAQLCHLPVEGSGKGKPGPPSRAFVFWSGERPVAFNIADSFDGCASATVPDVLSPGLAAASTPPGDPSKTPLSVSLVICTRDRPRELARCLASLCLQTRQPDEVVVIDNASLTTENEQICREAHVRYVRENRPGLDIARNTGAQICRSEIVAYTDDDVVLHPWWFERLVSAFDAPQIWAVTGLVLPAELATPAQWHFERYWGFGRGFQRIDFGTAFLEAHRACGCPTWLIGAGASMAFRRNVFAQIGVFDERLDVGAAGCSGDSEFWHRILCAGGTCRYEPSIVAFHYHRRDWEGLRKQIRAYMRGHAAALLVQYERSGQIGNLRRLFASFPQMYIRRLVRRMLRGKDPAHALTREEVAGLVSGLWFYVSTPRSKAASP